MSCDLVANFAQVQARAMLYPAWGAVTRAVARDRRFNWRWPNGGYALYRGETAAGIDVNFPVGVALRGATIVERLTGRPVTDGVLYFSVRGYAPMGVEDEADLPETVAVTLVSGQVQAPTPAAPYMVRVAGYVDGQIRVTVGINSVGAVVPAVSFAVYTDGGLGGGVDWNTPLGAEVPMIGAQGVYTVVRDPNLAHGTTLVVGVRTKAASGAKSPNTDTYSVVIDSEGPEAMDDFTVEAVCG